MLILYVVCLLFYAIGGFLFICLSPFPDCSKAPLGERRLFHYQLAVRLIPLNAYYSTQLFYCF